MGCDIHMFVEYKIDSGAWQAHDGHVLEIEEPDTEYEYEYVKEVSPTGRNYNLFAMLAGVRGEYDDSYEIRGVPHDVSKVVQLAVDNMEGDGHSHSYLSLDEFEGVLEHQDYKPTDRTDMFYNWQKITYDERPPDYTTIVAACKAQAKELSQVDKILLDSEEGSMVEHRVVFFFDN